MQCKGCGDTIPAGRLKAFPVTVHCVACSQVKAVGCVDIVYHKTGNTIQVMPKEQADAVNRSAKRSGFGSLAAMRGGSGEGPTGKYVHGVPLIRKSTEEDFELVGQEMMSWIEAGDRKRAEAIIDQAKESRLIGPAHVRQLRTILEQMIPSQVEMTEPERVELVNEETLWAFNNWRNCKTKR